MEELCHQLRYLPLLKRWATKANIRLLCEGKGEDDSTSTVVVSVVGFLLNSFFTCLPIDPVFRSYWSCWRTACGPFNGVLVRNRARSHFRPHRLSALSPRWGVPRAHRDAHGWRLSLVAIVTKTNDEP